MNAKSYPLERLQDALGERGESFQTLIEGVMRQVTIYSKPVDETWIMSTTVDEDGRIVASHQSLRGRLFTDEEIREAAVDAHSKYEAEAAESPTRSADDCQSG